MVVRNRKLVTGAVMLVLPAFGVATPASALARSVGKHGSTHHSTRSHHKAHTVSFYARVVHSSSKGLTVRTTKGKLVTFSAKQLRHKGHSTKKTGGVHKLATGATNVTVTTGSVVVNIVGLQPGVLVKITETTDANGNVTITITLPQSTGQETASGVVSEVDTDAFMLQATDGSTLRLHMAADALSNLGLQSCDVVDVTYHQDAGLLIADTVNVTDTSNEGGCNSSSTNDVTGAITQITSDSVTISGDQGPMTFSVDPSAGLTDGFHVGDTVDVTYEDNGGGTYTADDIELVEQEASGVVTAVTTTATGGSMTITNDSTGQSETFIANPDSGVELNASAFDGVAVGNHVEVGYHQSGGQLVADFVHVDAREQYAPPKPPEPTPLVPPTKD